MTTYPTAEKFITVGILILVGIIGLFAYQIYDGKYDPVYHYTPQEKIMPSFFIYKTQEGEVHLSFDYFIHFHTTSLSAQNPIFVEVKVYPTNDTVKSYASILPNQMKLILPNALTYPLVIDEKGDYDDANIILNKINLVEYQGTGTVIYQIDGQQKYMFVSDEEAKKHNDIFIDDDFKERIQNSDIPIGSTDLTATLKTNNIFLALTFVFIGFGVLELREQIMRGIIYVYELILRKST